MRHRHEKTIRAMTLGLAPFLSGNTGLLDKAFLRCLRNLGFYNLRELADDNILA